MHNLGDMWETKYGSLTIRTRQHFDHVEVGIHDPTHELAPQNAVTESFPDLETAKRAALEQAYLMTKLELDADWKQIN